MKLLVEVLGLWHTVSTQYVAGLMVANINIALLKQLCLQTQMPQASLTVTN